MCLFEVSTEEWRWYNTIRFFLGDALSVMLNSVTRSRDHFVLRTCDEYEWNMYLLVKYHT
jgi:hypothetical protein